MKAATTVIRHNAFGMAIAIALLVIVKHQTKAQGDLQVSADLRARSEYRHGFSTPINKNQKAAFFTDQRSRLIFDYKQTNYILKLSFQDVRVWGSQSQLVRNDGALTSLHEGWAQVLFTDALSFKVGRQEINLDDQRIFGAVDWTMQARAHDAAMIKYKKNDLEIQGAFAYNQDGIQNNTRYYTVPNNYKAMQFLWLHKEHGNFNGSFLFLNNGKQGGTVDHYRTYYSQTVGPRLGFKNDNIRSNATFYSQVGKEPDAVTRINAFYIAFDFAYKVSPTITITPGTELLSGNTAVGDGKNRAFAPFYGTNHKFNGLMDLFYVGNHYNSVGLHDFYTMIDYRKDKFSTSFRVHYFETAGKVIDQTNGNLARRKNLGTELDVTFQYRYSDQITFDGGYSHFLPTNMLTQLKGTGDVNVTQNWAWIMITIKPVLYKTPAPDQNK